MNADWARKAIVYCKEHGVDTIVHVGDFGYWGVQRWAYISHVHHQLVDAGIRLFFVDGNHEHHYFLTGGPDPNPIEQDGTRRITGNIHHLPRGYRWEWWGVQFLALGGAHSVDRQWRVEGVDWFREEIISISDAHTAVQGGIVDIMVTHDCPDDVDIPLGDNSWIPREELTRAEKHRQFLGHVVDSVQPKHLFHGHYHRSYEAERLNSNGTKTRIHGLDMDGTSMERNITIVDNLFDLTD